MHIGRTAKIGLAVGAIAGTLGITAIAQGLGPSSGGSLAELTAEVRQLRMVIQDAGRNQTQMQALNISLTAQHSRLTQVSERLDAIQEDLRKAAERLQMANAMLTGSQDELASLASAASARERADAAEQIKLARQGVDEAIQHENATKARQQELMSQFRQEEARWLELVARLDAIVKR